jgi:hypothetical protein
VIQDDCLKIIRGPEIPAIEAIVRDIEAALQAKLYYLAIIVCLTLPDVCAALESEDGRTSRERYKDWYAKHAKIQAGGVDPEECWSLRCGMTHQGKMDIANGGAGRVVFTIEHNRIRVDGVTLQSGESSAYAFDAEYWCRRWVSAIREWYIVAQHNPIVRRNMQELMQLRPFGLHPFLVGQPLIA